MRGHERLDEDDVRVRPGRGSRPRTRRRPAHEDAADAFVTGVDRGRYQCWTGDRVVTAMKARELGRHGVVVGDHVRLAGDATGQPGTLARVVQVLPRTSVLRRSAEDDDPFERIIVANADQLVIVTALADPPPRPRLIDRFLVAAYDARIEPLLCLTKSDLAAPDELIATYRPLGVRYLVTGRPLRAAAGRAARPARGPRQRAGRALRGGQVDAGERPRAGRRARGRQREPGDRPGPAHVVVRGRAAAGGAADGWIIDTPGLRSFGLANVAADSVLSAFPEFAGVLAECPPGCTHIEAGCALDDWVAAHGGPGAAARLDSLRRLLRSREGLDPVDTADPADS